MNALPHDVKTITSEDEPLRVDFLPDLGLQGTVGLTMLPGRKSLSFGDSPLWDRDMQQDLERLKQVYYTRALVTLIEPHEFEDCGVGALFPLSQTLGIEDAWFPIRDHFVPASVEAFDGLLQTLVKRVGGGQNIVLHCKAGKGRTGLTAGCLLVYLGWEPDEAIKVVHATREGTLTSDTQQQYLRYYRKFRQGERGQDPYELSAAPYAL